MGQRGNYIIKSKDTFDIFYTHWRANLIAQDLTLGPVEFIKFVKQFDKYEELINEPWIEGCVFIDLDSNELLFWEIEQLFEYSVREYYLKILEEKWKNWKVSFAEKEMYDIEDKMEIEYTKIQEKDFERIEIDKLIDDSIDEYVTCIVIIKKDDTFQLKNLYSGSDEQVALLGEQIIEILETKPSEPPKKESEIDVWNIILIDVDSRSLFINQNITGLKDELVDLWKGWEIEVGNFGYINLLEKAGLDTTNLRMKNDEIDERIKEILNYKDTFNPLDLAKEFLETDKEVKFHPNFFENIKPQKTIWERIKAIVKKK